MGNNASAPLRSSKNSTATKKAGEVFKNIVKIPKTISDNVQDVIKDTLSGKNVIDSVKNNAKDIAEEITGSFKSKNTNNNNNTTTTTDFFEDVNWNTIQPTTNDAPTTTIVPVIKKPVTKEDIGINVSEEVPRREVSKDVPQVGIESTGSFSPNGPGQRPTQKENTSRNDTNSFHYNHGKRPNIETNNSTSNVTNNYYFNGRNNTDMTMDMINNKTGSFGPGSSNQMMRPNSFGPGGHRPPGQFGGMNNHRGGFGGGQRGGWRRPPPPPINRYWK